MRLSIPEPARTAVSCIRLLGRFRETPKKNLKKDENSSCIHVTRGYIERMKANALKSMETGMKNVASRMVAAENNFVEVLMNFGEISKADAEKVLAVYRKLKLVKMDAVMGVMSVKHGAYLDKATIANALAM